MNAEIRKVRQGDAKTLAYIQTESWKAAFAGILDAETLAKCTDADRATAMYQRLLDENKGNGYLLSVDGTPHCIAYWDAARDAAFRGKAELICIGGRIRRGRLVGVPGKPPRQSLLRSKRFHDDRTFKTGV